MLIGAMPNPFGNFYHKENHDIVEDDLNYSTLSFDAFGALCDSVLNLHKRSQPQVCYKYQRPRLLDHHAVFSTFGINYDEPLTPMEIFQREAARRAQRLQNDTDQVPPSHSVVYSENCFFSAVVPRDTNTVCRRAEFHNPCRSDKTNVCHNSSSAQSLPRSDQKSKEVKVGCCVCFDDLQEIFSSDRHLMATFCGHIFCNSCLDAVVKTKPYCSVCRKKISKRHVHRIYL